MLWRVYRYGMTIVLSTLAVGMAWFYKYHNDAGMAWCAFLAFFLNMWPVNMMRYYDCMEYLEQRKADMKLAKRLMKEAASLCDHQPVLSPYLPHLLPDDPICRRCGRHIGWRFGRWEAE